jgi:hypothetical protein
VRLSDPAVVSFVPSSFVLGRDQVPLPVYGSPAELALRRSRAFRNSGKTWRWAMVDAVIAGLYYHGRLNVARPQYLEEVARKFG